jgi:NTE family protein
MNSFRLLLLVLAAALLTAALPSHAADRPKVGIALSGGAARGFAHVGVLKVLEEVGMPIDYVSGNSMGAVIGGLYAAGYSVAQIESISVFIDWDALFSDAIGRRAHAIVYKWWDSRYAMSFPLEGWRPELPSGLIAGQRITKLLSRLTLPVDDIKDFTKLPTPFVCVATDIEHGEVVVLDGGDLAEAIRASMSVPTMFTPVTIDGRLLVDGGVMRNLPAQDVRDLGADIVIGVDAAEPLYTSGELNSMVRIMDQTIHFQISGTSTKQKALCDVLIVPRSDKMSIRFDEVAYFIERGEEAARAVLPRLRELADSIRSLGTVEERWLPEPVDSLYVTAVAIAGLKDIPSRVVESELMINPPLWMSVDDIDKSVDRIYKYDFFERVGYSTSSQGEGNQLDLRVVEKRRNRLRAGLRYDSQTNLAGLVNVTLRNLGVQGSSLALEFRLGEELAGEIWYFTPAGRSLRSFGVSGRINTSWRRLNVYVDDFRAAVYRTTYTFGELLAGNIFASHLSVEGGARAEYIDTQLDSGVDLFPDQQDTMVPAFGALRFDTVDRTVFPRKGVFAHLIAEATSTSAGSDVAVTRYHFDWRIRVPLHRTVTLIQSLYLGTTPVGTPPAAYLFTMGGMDHPFTMLGTPNSFVGFKWQELAGPHAQSFGIGAQWEFYRRTYAIGRWNIGNAFNEWNSGIAWDDYEHGGGVTLGLDLPAAPVQITVSTSTRHSFLAQLTIGYWF